MRTWDWYVTDSKKNFFWPDYSPIFFRYDSPKKCPMILYAVNMCPTIQPTFTHFSHVFPYVTLHLNVAVHVYTLDAVTPHPPPPRARYLTMPLSPHLPPPKIFLIHNKILILCLQINIFSNEYLNKKCMLSRLFPIKTSIKSVRNQSVRRSRQWPIANIQFLWTQSSLYNQMYKLSH